MSNTKRSGMVCQNRKLDREPSLEQIPLGRYGVAVDGVNLSSTMTEDVRGFSLLPSYSAKQLRRIQHIVKMNVEHENRYLMSLQCNNEIFPERCDLLTSGSFLWRHSLDGDLE